MAGISAEINDEINKMHYIRDAKLKNIESSRTLDTHEDSINTNIAAPAESDCVVPKVKLSHKKWRRYLKKIRRKEARQKFAKRKELEEKEEERKKTDDELYKTQLEYEAKIKEQDEKETELQRIKEHQEWLQRDKKAIEAGVIDSNMQTEFIKVVKDVHNSRDSKDDQKKAGSLSKKELLKIELQKLEEQKNPPSKAFSLPEKPITNLKSSNWNQSHTSPGTLNPGYNDMINDPQTCKFFIKTGACKYGARCSRNHIRCESSSTILIPNFFQDARLEIPMLNEKCNDADIEYDELELVEEFERFYDDVIDEFQEAGNIVMFKCCRNFVPHLRGNVYVEYSKPEYAMEAFRKFNGRFYAGRQLSVELSHLTDWKSSICGLFIKRICPRGMACNFLHVFRNPTNAYPASHKSQSNVKGEISHTQSSSRNRERRGSRRNSRSPGRSRSRSPKKRRYRRKHSRSRSRSRDRLNSRRSHDRKSKVRHRSRERHSRDVP